ncbi:MAG: 6-bladed beta-propeller [Tannerellaceae bacterium]|jgi:hypothetical protein|nr:6-bladed beta-propeller [Tannerellaceae bacterium]
MKHIIYFLLLISLLLASGCNHTGGDLPAIDIVGALEARAYKQLPLSEFASEVEYVPLETGEGFLTDNFYTTTVTADRILVSSGGYCYAFTRQGKFITHIGKRGNGPGEYTFIAGVSVGEEGKHVYIETTAQVMEYTWDGVFVRSVDKPKLTETEIFGEFDRPQNLAMLRDNLFLGGVNNNSGKAPYSWAIVDNDGSLVKTFPRGIMLDKSERFMSTTLGAPTPFVVDGEAWIKEYINDTLFLLNRRDELVPKFVFGLGTYTFPRNVYLSIENNDDIARSTITPNLNRTTPMSITPRHIFFSADVGQGILSTLDVPVRFHGEFETTVQGVYNIRSSETVLLDSDPTTGKVGLVNDLDGGLPFWPRSYNATGREMVGVLEAYEMKELLTEEHFAAYPAKDRAAHSRLRELLKDLKDDDNPVIVIAKLKK